MATIIDALVVTLGLDAKGYAAGTAKALGTLRQTKDQAKKITSEMTADEQREAKQREEVAKREATAREDSAKRMGAAISRVRNEALALLGVLTAGMGIKNFTANTINSAASLGMMSRNLGFSTERLSAWQRAAERAGGSAEGITAQLRESANEVAKFRSGQAGESTQWFFRMGGTTADLRDGNTYLLARSRIVADIYKTDQARAALVASQMGISDEQFNLIKQGPAAIQALVAAQERRSSVSARDAAAALLLRNRYLDLRDTFSSVGTKILVELLPVFEKLVAQFQKLADWAAEHKGDIARWVDSAVEAITKFVGMANKAAEAVGGWQNVLLALAGLKILSIVTPLLSVAGALTSIAASLGLIGGASGAAGVAALGGLGMAAGGAALALYSKNLNGGEPELVDALNNKPANQPTAVDSVKKLQAMGWTREQAVGLVANFQAESNLNPQAVGDGGKAYGIGQWHPDRQADFRKAFGFDIRKSTLEQQLAFADWELRNTEATAREKLLAARTPQAAAEAVSRYYERPADADGDARKRAAAAGSLYRSVYMSDLGQTGAVGTANAAQATVPGNTTTTSNTTSAETNINGNIIVQTNATDAQGIARDMAGAIREHSFVPQVNTGLR